MFSESYRRSRMTKLSGDRRLRFEMLEARNLLDGDALLNSHAVEDIEQLLPSEFDSRGLEIEFHSGPVLAENTQAAAALNRAAEFWEGLFFDQIEVNIDAELVAEDVIGDDSLAETASQSVTYFYHDVRSLLIADASADESIVERLPDAQGELQFDTPEGIVAKDPQTDKTVIRLSRANAGALGFNNLPGEESAFTSGVTIDAYIQFNLSKNFDYDRSDGIRFGSFDFEAVAIHEIGHALGFISRVDSVAASVVAEMTGAIDAHVMDLFRLAPGQGENFSTAPRILNTGDNVPTQVFHDGRFDISRFRGEIEDLQTGDILLSTGALLGDDRQAGHFKDDFYINRTLGIMDPTLTAGRVGQVKEDTDLRILGLLGWDWRDTDQFGELPDISTESLETENNTPVLSGTVSDPDAEVYVRLPGISGTDTATLTVDGNSGNSDAFTLSNSSLSQAGIVRAEIILPGVGGGSDQEVAAPFFNTEGGVDIFDPRHDFRAVSADAVRVGLLTPQTDSADDGDVPAFSKVLELTFFDFDPGESISWRINMDVGNIFGDDIVGAQVKVEYDNGLSTSGVLQPIPGNPDASEVVLSMNHAIPANVDGEGAWQVSFDRGEPLPAGIHPIEAMAVDSSGAVVISEPATLTVFGPGGQFAYHNSDIPFDVDGNETVNSLDLLRLIRDLNANGTRILESPAEYPPPLFLDVHQDNFVNALDILFVVKELNRISTSAEGESEGLLNDNDKMNSLELHPQILGRSKEVSLKYENDISRQSKIKHESAKHETEYHSRDAFFALQETTSSIQQVNNLAATSYFLDSLEDRLENDALLVSLAESTIRRNML